MIHVILHKGGRGNQSLEFYLPESWNELTAGQLPDLAAALMLVQDPVLQKVEVARILLSLDNKMFSRIQPAVVFESILPLCKWPMEENDLTRQLLPVITAGDIVLYGPKDQLSNLRLIEWDFTERILADWLSAENRLEQLARLCAVLYRPAVIDYDFRLDPEGDCRIPFNDNLVGYYCSRIIETVPASTLFAILFWYRGCRKAITDAFSQVFSGKAAGTASQAEPGYFDLMRVIAKEGTYGDFDKVERMYLFNALQEIKCAKDEAERIKLNSKKR